MSLRPICRPLACCCAVVLLHCGGSEDGEPAAPLTELSFVTFNTALAAGLSPYPEQRLAAIERDLPGLSPDIVCLQEVWEPGDIQRISQALAPELPHAHFSVRSLDGTPGVAAAVCTETEAELLSNCLSESCAGVEGAGLPLCAVANCAPAFTQVSTDCQQCIASNQAATDVTDLATLCGSGAAGAMTYADQNGLLLLSRVPLSDLGYLKLDSSLGDRGVLSARVQTDFAGGVDVFCTHLAASLSQVPYTGPHGSWEGERLFQIEQLSAYVASRRQPDGSVALLGDLNCGPETTLAQAASPDAFARLSGAGFESVYAGADGRCTFCSDNPLEGQDAEDDEGAILDHVLLARFPELLTRSAARVLDDTIVINVGEDTLETARSDHYGVQVTVSEAELAQP
jgi:endonuclease/exonuclease/phosphatase family metal-dependent hydrolase